MKNIHDLEEKLGLKLTNSALLQRALTHRSYLNETSRKDLQSNERLEFLGDAVLELVISRWLYESFKSYPEGILTNLRSILVRTTSLAEIADRLNLGHYLLMSRGEAEGGGRQNPSLLANTVEAVIGAIYLDQGYETAQKFIHSHFLFLFERIGSLEEFKDPKSLLQEKLQAKTKSAPVYRLLDEEGPDHHKKFTVGVYSQGNLITRGTGKSLKLAEEAAAKSALIKIDLSGKISAKH